MLPQELSLIVVSYLGKSLFQAYKFQPAWRKLISKELPFRLKNMTFINGDNAEDGEYPSNQSSPLIKYYGKCGIEQSGRVISFSSASLCYNVMPFSAQEENIRDIVFHRETSLRLTFMYLTTDDRLRFMSLQDNEDDYDIIDNLIIASNVKHADCFHRDSLFTSFYSYLCLTNDNRLMHITEDTDIGYEGTKLIINYDILFPIEDIIQIKGFMMGSINFVAVLDQEHICRIYIVPNMILVERIPGVTSFVPDRRRFIYICDQVVCEWSDRGVQEIKAHIVPFLNTHLLVNNTRGTGQIVDKSLFVSNTPVTVLRF